MMLVEKQTHGHGPYPYTASTAHTSGHLTIDATHPEAPTKPMMVEKKGMAMAHSVSSST